MKRGPCLAPLLPRRKKPPAVSPATPQPPPPPPLIVTLPPPPPQLKSAPSGTGTGTGTAAPEADEEYDDVFGDGGGRCRHPVGAMRREGDGSIVCGECGSVLEGAARTLFFQHCATHAVAPQPAFVAPGECTGNTYVGADGRARPHFPRGASSAVKKLIATPSARECNARHVEADVRKLAARHALPSAVTADVLDAMRRVLDARVWTRGAYGERVTAAVVYYVCRQHSQPLTLEEVAAAQGCTPALMKRVCKRVLPVLEGALAVLDPSSWLKRAVHLMVTNNNSSNSNSSETIGSSSSSGSSGTDELEANTLSYAQMLYRLVVVPNSFGTGRKPLPVVAAVVALALEIVGGCETRTHIDATIRVLGARRKTVSTRYDELVHYLMGCARKINFGQKVTLKTLPQFGPIILRYLKETVGKTESETKTAAAAAAAESQASGTAAADLGTTKLPQSFVKVEKERERRRKLVADCKRMHAAMTQGLPFPPDVDITPEMCEVQKLLLEGVPEDMIVNNDTQALLNSTASMCLAVPPKTRDSKADGDDAEQLGPELDDSEVNSCIRDRSEVSILGKMREVTERDPSKSELLAAERKKQRGALSSSGAGAGTGTGAGASAGHAPKAVSVSQQRPSLRPIKASTRIDRERLAKLAAEVRPAEPLDGIL